MVWSTATVQSGELRAAHIAAVHASAGPSTPPGKQREEQRAEWKTQRRQVRTRTRLVCPRTVCLGPTMLPMKVACQSADCNWLQVIKVPGGSVLRGCKKTKRKLMEHFQLRAEVHSQLRLAICSAAMDMDWDPEDEAEPEPEPEPAPTPPTLRPPSARLTARHPPPAAPTGPPVPLDIEDPAMLQQLQVFCMYFANSTFLTPYNQLQRRLGRAGQNKHFSLKSAFDDPSNKELLAKLQQLGSTKLTGDHNTISHHSMQLAVAMQQHYSNPGNQPASQPSALPALPAKRSKRTKAEPVATEPTKGKGKAAKAKPAPQPGRWLDRDCNAALNMQRIGESKWRPLELCWWPDQGALPAKGKEYPGLGYKRV
ncbi:hypothetical protein QJQ45_018536 [Haematococcus lacustris]|nr:hypothetical protein QJQ45_018536 [Haematococcus lacustris]